MSSASTVTDPSGSSPVPRTCPAGPADAPASVPRAHVVPPSGPGMTASSVAAAGPVTVAPVAYTDRSGSVSLRAATFGQPAASVVARTSRISAAAGRHSAIAVTSAASAAGPPAVTRTPVRSGARAISRTCAADGAPATWNPRPNIRVCSGHVAVAVPAPDPVIRHGSTDVSQIARAVTDQSRPCPGDAAAVTVTDSPSWSGTMPVSVTPPPPPAP